LLLILQSLIRQDKILVYADDILIPTETVDENLKILSQCLRLLKQYVFEVNYKKCLFLKKEIKYVGYIVSSQRITLSERYVKAIKSFPIPRYVHEVQRFLGLVGFLGLVESSFPILQKKRNHSIHYLRSLQ